MCSLIWARGLNTLGLTGQTYCTACTKGVACISISSYVQRGNFAPTRYLKTRCNSLASFSRPSGPQDGEDARGDNGFIDVIEEVPSTGDSDTSYDRKLKVLLIEKKSKIVKSLIGSEAPLLHHAQEGAVVDVRNDLSFGSYTTSEQGAVEVRLRVDQLLKESVLSVQRAKKLKDYEEDLEYVEETEYHKKEKMELVGALHPSALDWRPQKIDVKKLGSYYAGLSKSRLTGLVVITAVAGYAMAPAPFDPVTLLLCSLGTGLTSSAANAINQECEIPYDSQMDRTRNRILVRGLLSPLHAVCFAIACSTTGISMLYFGANGVAASLGALNLLLYTCVYTPMKRLSILNTWIGSIVGAIPPMIGWAACTGGLEPGAWIMAGILYAWQFPHFNALSWNLRPDYSRAGYRMMSVTDPGLCRRVALRYSFGMIGISTLSPMMDVTTWTFAIDTLPLNGYLTYLAWRFYQDADSKSSRKLFLFTLAHLPVFMMLMIISKKHYGKSKNVENEKISTSSDETPVSESQVSVSIPN